VAPKRRQQRLLAASHVQKPLPKRICRLLLSVAAVGALERVVWTFHFNSSRNRPADNQRAMFYSHKEIWYE
jgi:hypothetical protein